MKYRVVGMYNALDRIGWSQLMSETGARRPDTFFWRFITKLLGQCDYDWGWIWRKK